MHTVVTVNQAAIAFQEMGHKDFYSEMLDPRMMPNTPVGRRQDKRRQIDENMYVLMRMADLNKTNEMRMVQDFSESHQMLYKVWLGLACGSPSIPPTLFALAMASSHLMAFSDGRVDSRTARILESYASRAETLGLTYTFCSHVTSKIAAPNPTQPPAPQRPDPAAKTGSVHYLDHRYTPKA
ncbi:MAG: hypothetical protein IPI58_08295 [Alphaproteobacteria bacterium]|nr:MAG: hypothetical protein IPI58_08295 [Alphaproteobacteria bacterium]